MNRIIAKYKSMKSVVDESKNDGSYKIINL